MGHHNALLGKCKRDMLLVRSASEAGVRGGRHVDSPPAQPAGDGVADVLVKMKAEHRQSG